MSARFTVGETVMVRADYPTPPCHIRTPFYIRGKTGAIERICGEYRNPEQLAFGNYAADVIPLYRVRFEQADVWPEYDGNPEDKIEVEIFEHWLEPAQGGA